MFLINSPPHVIRCAPTGVGEGLSRSYACCFAEFLNPSYLDRLSILYLSTSVCSRYGLNYQKRLEVFLDIRTLRLGLLLVVFVLNLNVKLQTDFPISSLLINQNSFDFTTRILN